MAELKQGVVASWRRLSDVLAILQLLPEPGSSFPSYKPGQYIALQRENCRLTHKVLDSEGRMHYPTDLDPSGNPKHGPVTHSYSISSAPFETLRDGYLEFYVVLESDEEGHLGRLTESLFSINSVREERVNYYNRITGTFTLDQRTTGFRNVLLVGTGTGLAPFVAMIKQLHYEASHGRNDGVRYTLIHANRTRAELGYHRELNAIAVANAFDFTYVASISRPTPQDIADPSFATGRANNVLRHLFGMPLKEEEDSSDAEKQIAAADSRSFRRTVRPKLPRNVEHRQLLDRLDPANTVLLCCGNPWSMTDIKLIADRLNMHFEKEDWKPVHG